ncbi:LysR family transcriptional regulator [Microbacteriaceae bacterium VKM Ac-2854]|nr:LysR family transcriptional regulator [Microbacteriaceae bacterium VKM Ac-2854]
MKISHLRHFVAVAEELHFVRAAEALGISRRKLDSSVEALESELGTPLFDRDAPVTTLSRAGKEFLPVARAEIAAAPEAGPPPGNGGGKAKANKGVGRKPHVKGDPKPKRRQSR